MVKEVVQDYQHAVLQVSDTQYDEDIACNIPQVSYEFPNGYHDEYGVDRFKIAEALFDPIKIRVPNANTMLSMAHVLTTSVGKLTFKLNIIVSEFLGGIMIKFFLILLHFWMSDLCGIIKILPNIDYNDKDTDITTDSVNYC